MIERLPEKLAVEILWRAYLASEPADELNVWKEYGGVNPLRTVVPLVCKAWNNISKSPNAARVFYSRVRIVDSCLLHKGTFWPKAMLHWYKQRAQAHVRELEVDVSTVFSSPAVLTRLSDVLAEMILCSPRLTVLHLLGELDLDRVFAALPAPPGALGSLRAVRLGRGGGSGWGVESCVRALSHAPGLVQLQLAFRLDVGLPPPELPHSLAGLTRLRHLALAWPTRSALPPAAPLPDSLGDMEGLTTLQLRRVPANAPPDWLGKLTGLRHLYWDLCLPADVTPAPPLGLPLLVELRTLYLDLAPPFLVPDTLTELRTLVIAGHARPDDAAASQDWSWLAAFKKLRSLCIQGAGLTVIPPALRDLPALQRVALNNNALRTLSPGPWLAQLQHLHLGLNSFAEFPAELREARALRTLQLANQRGRYGSGGRQVWELELAAADVTALCTLPDLRLVIMSQSQPRCVPGGDNSSGAGGSQGQSNAVGGTEPTSTWGALRRDYLWLQRELKWHGRRLSSNELAYKMEDLPMFNVAHISWDRYNVFMTL